MSPQISPLEIEDVLLRHPLVCDVAVVGLTDANGQYSCAFVLARDEAVRSQHILDYAEGTEL